MLLGRSEVRKAGVLVIDPAGEGARFAMGRTAHHSSTEDPVSSITRSAHSISLRVFA